MLLNFPCFCDVIKKNELTTEWCFEITWMNRVPVGNVFVFLFILTMEWNP